MLYNLRNSTLVVYFIRGNWGLYDTMFRIYSSQYVLLHIHRHVSEMNDLLSCYQNNLSSRLLLGWIDNVCVHIDTVSLHKGSVVSFVGARATRVTPAEP